MTITVKYQGKTYVCKGKTETAEESADWIETDTPMAGFRGDLVDGGILVLGKDAANRAVYILND